MTGCVLNRPACRSCAMVDEAFARRRPTPRKAAHDSAVPGGTTSGDDGLSSEQPAVVPVPPQSAATG